MFNRYAQYKNPVLNQSAHKLTSSANPKNSMHTLCAYPKSLQTYIINLLLGYHNQTSCTYPIVLTYKHHVHTWRTNIMCLVQCSQTNMGLPQVATNKHCLLSPEWSLSNFMCLPCSNYKQTLCAYPKCSQENTMCLPKCSKKHNVLTPEYLKQT